MKSNKFQPRFYREWMQAAGLIKSRVVEKETDIFVLTDKPIDKEYLKERVIYYRRQIEDYINIDRSFLTSLEPIKIKSDTQDIAAIAKDMIEATKIVGVGPMAAVAGAVAHYLGMDLLQQCNEVIVENGGDIFLKISGKKRIGVYAGDSPLSGKVFLEIEPKNTPFGVCTSSGTVGHSLSFGKTDATVIMADSAMLADAAATAVGNIVKSKADLESAISFAQSIKGITGALIIIGETLSAWGDIKISK